eukprot:TRINITY_DN2791_c0_g5_i2.p1 TRINITY_DN2791_c0_g5~~TRINITY_DN2791_c0_g5_i2.p1  ORF type:complete len:1500 (+),score=497.07 TRINITY_DN2791_c0_g5_i2:505-4500(+)
MTNTSEKAITREESLRCVTRVDDSIEGLVGEDGQQNANIMPGLKGLKDLHQRAPASAARLQAHWLRIVERAVCVERKKKIIKITPRIKSIRSQKPLIPNTSMDGKNENNNTPTPPEKSRSQTSLSANQKNGARQLSVSLRGALPSLQELMNLVVSKGTLTDYDDPNTSQNHSPSMGTTGHWDDDLSPTTMTPSFPINELLSNGSYIAMGTHSTEGRLSDTQLSFFHPDNMNVNININNNLHVDMGSEVDSCVSPFSQLQSHHSFATINELGSEHHNNLPNLPNQVIPHSPTPQTAFQKGSSGLVLNRRNSATYKVHSGRSFNNKSKSSSSNNNSINDSISNSSESRSVSHSKSSGDILIAKNVKRLGQTYATNTTHSITNSNDGSGTSMSMQHPHNMTTSTNGSSTLTSLIHHPHHPSQLPRISLGSVASKHSERNVRLPTPVLWKLKPQDGNIPIHEANSKKRALLYSHYHFEMNHNNMIVVRRPDFELGMNGMELRLLNSTLDDALYYCPPRPSALNSISPHAIQMNGSQTNSTLYHNNAVPQSDVYAEALRSADTQHDQFLDEKDEDDMTVVDSVGTTTNQQPQNESQIQNNENEKKKQQQEQEHNDDKKKNTRPELYPRKQLSHPQTTTAKLNIGKKRKKKKLGKSSLTIVDHGNNNNNNTRNRPKQKSFPSVPPPTGIANIRLDNRSGTPATNMVANVDLYTFKNRKRFARKSASEGMDQIPDKLKRSIAGVPKLSFDAINDIQADNSITGNADIESQNSSDVSSTILSKDGTSKRRRWSFPTQSYLQMEKFLRGSDIMGCGGNEPSKNKYNPRATNPPSQDRLFTKSGPQINDTLTSQGSTGGTRPRLARSSTEYRVTSTNNGQFDDRFGDVVHSKFFSTRSKQIHISRFMKKFRMAMTSRGNGNDSVGYGASGGTQDFSIGPSTMTQGTITTYSHASFVPNPSNLFVSYPNMGPFVNSAATFAPINNNSNATYRKPSHTMAREESVHPSKMKSPLLATPSTRIRTKKRKTRSLKRVAYNFFGPILCCLKPPSSTASNPSIIKTQSKSSSSQTSKLQLWLAAAQPPSVSRGSTTVSRVQVPLQHRSNPTFIHNRPSASRPTLPTSTKTNLSLPNPTKQGILKRSSYNRDKVTDEATILAQAKGVVNGRISGATNTAVSISSVGVGVVKNRGGSQEYDRPDLFPKPPTAGRRRSNPETVSLISHPGFILAQQHEALNEEMGKMEFSNNSGSTFITERTLDEMSNDVDEQQSMNRSIKVSDIPINKAATSPINNNNNNKNTNNNNNMVNNNNSVSSTANTKNDNAINNIPKNGISNSSNNNNNNNTQ